MVRKRQCPQCKQVYLQGESYCIEDGTALQDLPASRMLTPPLPGVVMPAPAASAPRIADDPVDQVGPVDPNDPWIGQVLGGRFKLLQSLGEGGMGMVYLANHLTLERLYAIKLLRHELLWDDAAVQRFYREARIISALSHPYIVSVYDCGHAPSGEPYLAMEYVEGINLLQWKAGFPRHALPIPQAVDIALRVMTAMAYAHEKGIVHRELVRSPHPVGQLPHSKRTEKPERAPLLL